MAARTDGDAVERMIRRRRLILIIVSIGYVLWQGAYIVSALKLGIASSAAHAIDIAGGIGFTLWLVALVYLLFVVGAATGNPAMREAMNDELTQANRSAAFVTGFWAVMIAVVTLYAIGLFQPLTAAQVMPILMAIGVTVPVMRFIALDRRGESDG